MIQGNYKDQWENDEFEKLRSIVSKVEEGTRWLKPTIVASVRQGWISYAGTHVPMFVHRLGLIKP